MKKITKLLAALLTAALAAGLTPAISASSAPSINIGASDAELGVGDTVEVNVSLANNPGIACMLLHVDYNSDAFELIEVTDANVLGDDIHSNDKTLDPYTLFWFNGLSNTDYTVNGTIVTLTFKVTDDAVSGNYEFDISYDNSNAEILNVALETVDFDVVPVSVSVNGTEQPETDAPDTDAPETDAPETDAPETDAPDTDRDDDKDDEDDKKDKDKPNRNDKDDETEESEEPPETDAQTSPVAPVVPVEPDAPESPVVPEAGEAASEWQNPFVDVKETEWYFEAVKYVNVNGIMNGLAGDTFAPNGDVTRAMFVTMLYRIEKEPTAAKSAFADIQAGIWYENAVGWASANGIVNGISESEFAPNALISREQMATIIYRYAAYKGKDTAASEQLAYSDASAVSDYAAAPMSWAVKSGLITGTSADTLSPKANATRAQSATILRRMIEAWA